MGLSMPFKKGQSGNPGGRPKEATAVTQFAQLHCISSIKTLLSIRDNPEAPHASRIAAATAIMDRGLGRPAQSVALGQDEALGPIQITWGSK